MKFYNEHKTDEFEILAFHDTAAKTFEELDERVQPAKSKHWNGQDLPFPILLDSTGKTIEQFEVSMFPTMVLFDPEGRLVGKADLDKLKSALKGEVHTPEPLEIR